MTEKIRKFPFYLMVAGMAMLSLSSWYFSPVVPVDEFEELVCNKIYSDSTKGETDSYNQDNYSMDCVSDGENFGAGDKLYRFTVADTNTFLFQFGVLDESDLHVLIMSNTIDPETETDCPDTCMFRMDGTSDLEVELLPGIYWLSVDGLILDNAGQGEGVYELSVTCDNVYDEISCGQIITDSTTGYFNSYDTEGNYLFCTPSEAFDGPDRIYRFELMESQEISITLDKLDNNSLALVLMAEFPINDTYILLCSRIENNGGSSESIVRTLGPGVYYIAVDATNEVVDDVVVENSGAYRLSLKCEVDHETLLCGDLVTGNTAERVNNHTSAEYTGCAPAGSYEAGDKTYLFDLMNDDDITFTLTPTEGADLGLIVINAIYDDVTESYSYGDCVFIKDTAAAGVEELIKMPMTAGAYFVIVDGAENDESAMGPYMLKVVCAALPIELISFTGISTEEGVQLDWVTASEIAFEGFQLQRSEDGNVWNNLSWQIAKGSPESKTAYSYMDKQPMDGSNFYRLRSVDLDGTVNISNIVQVNYQTAGGKTKLSVYPTLATEWLNVGGVESGTPVRYEIRSPLGYLLKEGKLSESGQTVDISNLSSGMLYITLTDGTRFNTVSFRKL